MGVIIGLIFFGVFSVVSLLLIAGASGKTRRGQAGDRLAGYGTGD